MTQNPYPEMKAEEVVVKIHLMNNLIFLRATIANPALYYGTLALVL